VSREFARADLVFGIELGNRVDHTRLVAPTSGSWSRPGRIELSGDCGLETVRSVRGYALRERGQFLM
jgi:hypothetical protein